MITEQYIYDKIPIEYRFFFHIVMPNEVPPQYQGCIDNLISAILLLIPYAHFNKKVTLVISGISQQYHFDNIHLSCHIEQPTLLHGIGNTIFYHLDKLEYHSKSVQIALFLQQLVQIFLNIKDEIFAQKLVQLIYPQANIENNQFI